MKKFLPWLVFAFFSLLGLVFANGGGIAIGLLSILISDLAWLSWVVRCEGKKLSPFVIFCLFLAIYGWYGVCIFELFPEYGGEAYLASKSAWEYLFCNFLAKVGFSLPFFFIKTTKNPEIEKSGDLPRSLAACCIVFCFTATTFELINFFRAGGIPLLIGGKSLYQSLVDELFLTLPTLSLFYIAISSLSLLFALRTSKTSRKDWCLIIICVLFLSPMLLIYFILGRRGPIMNAFIIFFAAREIVKDQKLYLFKVVILLSLLGLISGGIYWFRNIGLVSFFTGDFQLPLSGLWDVFIHGLGEFRAPYGNFNMYFVNRQQIDLQLGATYWSGFMILIPGYFLPFPKPQSITYVFRDLFFSSWAIHGSISGTAFSPILESFINFSYYAIPLIFLLYNLSFRLVMGFFKKSRVYSSIVYLATIPLAQSFHRSEFGNFLSVSVEILVLLCLNKIIYSFVQQVITLSPKLNSLFATREGNRT
ncbi:MAG: hypothetical protein WA705_19700 [Candidatus Ozemobacteraceae bacterium]